MVTYEYTYGGVVRVTAGFDPSLVTWPASTSFVQRNSAEGVVCKHGRSFEALMLPANLTGVCCVHSNVAKKALTGKGSQVGRDSCRPKESS